MPKQLSELAGDLRALKQAAQNPKAEDIRPDLQRWQSVQLIGQERRLGPSLKNPGHADHVFELVGGRVRYGTRVPYAIYNLDWRVKNGFSNFLRVPDDVVKRISGNIVKTAFEDTILK